MTTKNFTTIVSNEEHIWINNCLSRGGIGKKISYKSWAIPSEFKHYYNDGTNRIFKISFPESAYVEPIINIFSVNSGREIQFSQPMQELCKTIAIELGNEFKVIFQALDIDEPTALLQHPANFQIVTEHIIKQRTQQQKYRQNVINLWGKKCSLTNVNFVKILTASHIKGFSMCNSNEAYDSANGLLLCAHIDKLFDQGFITFDNEGKIIKSKLLPRGFLQQIGINENAKLLFRNLTKMDKKAEILNYMEYHRYKIFLN
ncbi:HNH endonuclease [Neisseria animaloris]|uniref:HNH endonuclease n=1 Tax=Neisseria animaloris TaxID=326522 RepID=UPI000D3664C0|nr:HNH endonuclease [Neisseria animaloris]